MSQANERAKYIWRETMKGGLPALVSCRGKAYFGTRQEVREARMMPASRKYLFERIATLRHCVGTMGKDRVRSMIMAARRDAICFDASVCNNPFSGLGGCGNKFDRISAEAAARFLGCDFREFVRLAVASYVKGVISKAGGRLPITRHEARAIGLADGVSSIDWKVVSK